MKKGRSFYWAIKSQAPLSFRQKENGKCTEQAKVFSGKKK
jgi:hypothetical protein